MDARSLVVLSVCIAVLFLPWAVTCDARTTSTHMQVGLVIQDVCTVTTSATNGLVVVKCTNPSTSAQMSNNLEGAPTISGVATPTSDDNIVTILF